METHFDKPQRQSKIGILIMFLDSIQHYGRAFWPILVLWILKFNEISKLYYFICIPVIFIIIGIIAYLKFINFTFYLDHQNDEFIITNGVFNKTKTAIQLHKIQQVNINQSLIQRIIGVYTLDVDTAGSNSKEGIIKAISHPLAIELKSRLLDNDNKIENLELVYTKVADNLQEAQPFISISLLSLIKIGITSNYVKSFSLLLIFFFTITENINNFTGNDILNNDKIQNYFDQSFIVQTILVAVFVIFFIVLLINLGRVIIKYFDFNITKQKGSLLMHYGLINTKSTISKPEKVQITAITQNYFQKRMNILELKIKQATGGVKEKQKAGIEIPGCNAFEKDEILKLIFDHIPEKGVMLKPNFRKFGFALFVTIGLPLFGFYFFRVNNPTEGLQFNYVIPFYVLFMGILNYFFYKNHRLFINNKCIIKQSGAWDITNEIIVPSKIQAISTSQLFWHKNLNIGSLTLHTAAGNLTLQLGDFTKIKEYINLWLYEIETSDSNWM